MFQFLLVSIMLFACIFVYADNPKINIQGRLTKDFGDPITGKKVKIQIGDLGSGTATENTDSEGLYNVNVSLTDLTFSADTDYTLYVYDSSNNKELAKTSIKFQHVPFSIYSSTATYAVNAGTATYALELSTSGTKLVNDNFITTSTYTIAVSSADYAVNAGTATYAKDLNPNFKLTNNNFSNDEYSNLKLRNSNFFDTGISTYTIVVSSADYAVKAETATKVSLADNSGLDNSDGLKVSTGTGLTIDSDKLVVKLALSELVDVSTTTNVTNGEVLTYNDGKWENKAIPALSTATTTNLGGVIIPANGGLSVDNTGNVTINNGTGLAIGTSGSDKDKLVVNLALSGISDVSISSVSNGQVLTYNNNNQQWENSEVDKLKDTRLDTYDKDDINNFVWVKNDKGQGWVKLNAKTEDGQIVTGADLAEMYASSENLQPGDVVSIDTTRNDAVVKTKVAEDTKVAGVVSTEPGLLLNKNQKGYKLALVGKVPTKVCNEGGNIKRGDLLVSASIAGYAKKAGANPKPGTIIGKALANFSSKKGTILVLVNLQ